MSAEAVFFAAYVFLMFAILATILAGQEGIALLLVLIAGGCAAATIYFGSVGGRAPSPSPGVATATPAVSEMAPARPRPSNDGTTVQGGNGEDGETRATGLPASTVTTQALTQEGGTSMGDPPPERWVPPQYVPSRPTVTASPAGGGALTPSAVPATPVTTSPAVVTQGAESDIWGLIAASPWPQYLWGAVACLVERESGGLAWKVGLEGERGLMQVHPVTWAYLAEHGFAPDALFDPGTNLRAAWELYLWNEKYNGDGLTPWKSTRGGC